MKKKMKETKKLYEVQIYQNLHKEHPHYKHILYNIQYVALSRFKQLVVYRII